MLIKMLTVISRSSTSTVEGTGLADTVTGKNQLATVKKYFVERNRHTAEQQNDCVELKLHLFRMEYFV